jgi:hypothetical protein
MRDYGQGHLAACHHIELSGSKKEKITTETQRHRGSHRETE